MVRIRPFRAIRPEPHVAARVASLPYDVVSREEAKELASGHPESFLHVVRSEIDLPDDVDAHDETVYARARENFRRLIDEGLLVQERTPSMYLYRQVVHHRPQVGLVCCCHVEDYEAGVIKRHEKTRPDKEDDRTRHTLAINANAGPVFLAYRDDPALANTISEDMNDRPLFHFNAPDGVTHSAWTVKNPQQYVQAFDAVPAFYVADGHHRAASAVRAARARREANPAHRGDEAYNWFLTVLFPAGELTILPYNRVIRGLKGRSESETLERLRAVGTLTPCESRCPATAGRFGVYFGGGWHELVLDPATIDRGDPIAGLDVDLLQQRVLGPVFGIEDPRTDPDLDFVGGVRGPEHLERLVDSGRAAFAFSLHPTTIDQLLDVADAGLIMPPKSTWFEPKLRSGLFVHSLDQDPATGPA